jgi:large subunit ribosomal protein L9
MKVVLNQDIKGIGKKLQIIEVSEGYARNFLLPKKLAVIADNKSVNESKGKIEAQKFKKNTEIEEANCLKNKLEESYVEFKHKIGDNGKLFGSITEKEIAEELKNKFSIDITKKKISIKFPIKQLGTYIVEVKLYEGVIAKLKVVVIGL